LSSLLTLLISFLLTLYLYVKSPFVLTVHAN
jgi:hypothetical protein